MLEGEAATPAGVAAALATMTLAVGRRVIIVEGVERWRQADVEKQLAPAIAQMPPETTLAMFAREEARAKAPAALHDAVKRAGGQIVAQMTVKPWELAKWAREQAARLGLALDAAAAKALVAQVGERQQRLLRELEKLALEGDQRRRARAVRRARRSKRARRTRQSGAPTASPTRSSAATRARRTLSYLRLREQGERLSGLIYLMAARLRDALAIALRLQAGESVGGGQARSAHAGARRRALRRGRRAHGPRAAARARSQSSPSSSSTRVAAPRSWRAARADAALVEDTIAQRAIEAITR